MLLSTLSLLAAAPGCDPGVSGIDLGNCLTLGPGKATVKSVYAQPTQLINILVSNLFVLAGIILFLLIIYAGFKFIQSGSKGKDEAKSIITTAAAGYIIMFIAYWIVQVVEIVIGQEIMF
ncbi:MAG TPA: hypothetical protein VD999_02410 [Vitreimonas sp.]|nr:hypothetical protein [Vitreimonas sp.]